VVLFDLDGTLIDTFELIYQSYRHLVQKRLGCDITREEVLPYIGTPLRRQFMNQFPSETDESLDRMVDEFMAFQYSIYRDHLRAFPGAVEALAGLKGLGVLTGVVTSRRRESTELYTRELGLRDHLDVVVAMEDTEAHKPGPEPVLKALAYLGMAPSGALVVGDAEFDILSGQRAGTDTGFALWGPNDPSRLPVKPTYLLKSPNDLLVRTG
jgi:pyrophosphatase PpaX